ncbi:hypothetical protein IMG5_201350 [Ichthyophthirius multifiliis]|uniref:Uncharacterized protein n=1 Tax=Ichthyophthirius multifiliis TaxID=5932 RepID=G0R5Y9_ICHMU|nr:hypothetical protein IMG5_201350 [Ichthyophthirius multifiliis]EGR27113.1 hypothetical protein IMG5_201350 [Ichthyophthirius multifiliis]|eukprot:XP_004023997.1 hypothetical protein IMG5_201350 [Ichthyophthirius multifiliis]
MHSFITGNPFNKKAITDTNKQSLLISFKLFYEESKRLLLENESEKILQEIISEQLQDLLVFSIQFSELQ